MPDVMEEGKSQKELFEFEKPKRSFPKLSNFLPKADFERNILITLSLEKIMFVSIGLILAMVVVYALGIEVGKARRSASQIVQRVSVKKVTAAASQVLTRPHIIVAGAYSRKDNALSAMARLKQAGFDSYIGQNAPLFQVWVGAKTGSDALKELAKVKKLCKDAYLKTR
ncbi:MAG: SPOR domain-containing protein [Candidatus Omnitrophica bacterium]|nr:SPOR domain-containing protein [Candidatus Omnitrophota bacterium]